MTLSVSLDDVVICFLFMIFVGMMVDRFMQFRGL
jgi:hypothetical protein